jgi:hypothetical protein
MADASSIACFRQELRRLASALLVTEAGHDIHWEPADAGGITLDANISPLWPALESFLGRAIGR